MLGAIGGLGYLVVSAAFSEGALLINQVHSFLVVRGTWYSLTPCPETHEVGVSQQQIDKLTSQLEGQAQTAVPLIGQFVNDTLSLVIDIVLVLVLSIYLLVDGARFGSGCVPTAPLKQRSGGVPHHQRADGCRRLHSWPTHTLHPDRPGGWPGHVRVAGTLCDPLGLTGLHIGVHSDSWHADLGVVCVLVAATQSWLLALVVLAYFVVIHVLEGYVVAPRVLGKAVGLHPAISIIALVAGADLFGLWGAIFAAPLAGLLQVLLAATWQAWREQNPRQFADVFGPTVVPVTTAEHGRGEDMAETDLSAPFSLSSRSCKKGCAHVWEDEVCWRSNYGTSLGRQVLRPHVFAARFATISV